MRRLPDARMTTTRKGAATLLRPGTPDGANTVSLPARKSGSTDASASRV